MWVCVCVRVEVLSAEGVPTCKYGNRENRCLFHMLRYIIQMSEWVLVKNVL